MFADRKLLALQPAANRVNIGLPRTSRSSRSSRPGGTGLRKGHMGRMGLWIGLRISLLCLCVVLSGCGQSTDRQIDEAQLALEDGAPDEARVIVDEVLETQPRHRRANMLLSKILQVKLEFDAARVPLELVLEADAKDGEALDQMVTLERHHIRYLLDLGVTPDNETRAKTLTDAIALGRKFGQALVQTAPSDVIGHDQMAQLADLEAEWLGRTVEALRRQAEDFRAAPYEIARFEELLRRERLARADKIEEAAGHLRRAVETSSPMHRSWQHYARLMLESQAWTELWPFAQRITGHEEIPADLAQSVIEGLMDMPDHERPAEDRWSLGMSILERVQSDQMDSSTWITLKIRLHQFIGAWEKAAPLLTDLVRKAPGSEELPLLDALNSYGMDDLSTAYEMTRALVSDHPELSRARALHGMILARQGNAPLAARELRVAIDGDPSLLKARATLAELLAEQSQFTEAESLMLQAVRDSDYGAAELKAALRYLRHRGETTSVNVLLEELEAIGDDLNAGQLETLVEGLIYLREAERAMIFAERMARRRPDLEHATWMPVHVAIAARQLDRARSLARPLMSHQDVTVEPAALARIAMQRQQYDDVVTLLLFVAAHRPDDLSVRLDLAEAYFGLGRINEAREWINRVLAEQPTHTRAHTLAALTYLFEGQRALAFGHLIQINTAGLREQTHPLLHALLAINHNDLDEAILISRQPTLEGNDQPLVRHLLAMLYHETGDEEQAEAVWITNVHLFPAAARTCDALKDFYIQQAQAQRGLLVFQALREVSPFHADLAAGSLQMSLKRPREAARLLAPTFAQALKQRHPATLMLADALANARLAFDPVDSAQVVYDEMIQAKLEPVAAALHKLDILSPHLPREEVIDKLVALGNQVRARPALRQTLIDRLKALDADDQALELLSNWTQTLSNPDTDILLEQGRVLIRLGRPNEAADIYRRALEDAPDNRSIRIEMAQAYTRALDFPAAEATYLEGLIPQREEHRPVHLALAAMLHDLGLNRRASSIIDEMQLSGDWPDVTLAMDAGILMFELKLDYSARELLGPIPLTAPQYARAQILLSRIDQRRGDTDKARTRLHELLRTSLGHNPAIDHLLKMDVSIPSNWQLIEWANEAIDVTRLSADTHFAWMRLRINLRQRNAHWVSLLELYQRMREVITRARRAGDIEGTDDDAENDTTREANLKGNRKSDSDGEEPAADDSTRIVQGAILLNIRLARLTDAQRLYTRNAKTLDTLPGAPLWRIVIQRTSDESLESLDTLPPVSRYFAAMVSEDYDTARQAVADLPPGLIFTRTDLLSAIDQVDIASPENIRALRTLAGAQWALDLGLPHLARELSQSITEVNPLLTPAYAMLAESLIQIGDTTDAALQPASQRVPTALLTTLLDLRRQHAEFNKEQALVLARRAHEREPDNPAITLLLAEMLRENNLSDEAETILQTLETSTREDTALGPALRKQIITNLAELLIQKDDETKRTQADGLLSSALDNWPDDARLLNARGLLAHKRDQPQAALKPLVKAARLAPTDPSIHLHLGLVHRALENDNWSRYHLDQAANLDQANPASREAKRLLNE